MSFKNFVENEYEPKNGSVSLFVEENPHGYLKKIETVKILDELGSDQTNRWILIHLSNFFKFAKLNGSFNRSPQHTIEDGKGFTWLTLKIGRVIKPCKVIHFGEMKRLIDDYASGKLKINQTLEELYEQASNS
ncbi:hypothetical protein [Pedobacter sp. GR22-10]|uniref:hypothetical protein n=1 Tax=Pedobacter sp. GR22-10 TaxID=2994472 RepID=UPI002246D467|nr:hypothetical protein [Pedobacter sp. GR22-10]MCX2431102.1 hypothetical protein [Pedobacter sp. GR22-10]